MSTAISSAAAVAWLQYFYFASSKVLKGSKQAAEWFPDNRPK